MRYSPSLAACTLAVALLTGQAAVAEPIPEAVLLRDFQQCSAGNPKDPLHIQYCWCVINEVRGRMSLQSYLTESGEGQKRMNDGSDIRTAVAQSPILMQIIGFCQRQRT